MFLGVDIGGTKTAVCIGDQQGNILDKIKFPTSTPQKTVEQIIASGRTLLNGQQPLAIGISCGSPQDAEKGIIQAPPNLPDWVDIPITDILGKAFYAPAFLANDANACALAEWKFGAGAGTKNMIFLTFGTGMGAGLILNGKLYEGTCGMAGEAGHMRLTADGPIGFGKAGSFEGYCSGGGIVKLAQQMGHHSFSNTKEICDAAKLGDPVAKSVIDESARQLGQGLSILIDLLNPQRIVIGSIFARAEALFRPEMERIISQEVLDANRTACQIVPAQLGERIGDVAALSIAVVRWEETHHVQ